MISRDKLTVIYYSANKVNDYFANKVREILGKAIEKRPLISVTQKPLQFGENICVGDIGASNLNIYRQALIGAKAATTPYIAMAEDDTLYHKDHFDYIPSENTFAYNMNRWSLFTWSDPPIFSNRNRKTLNALICPRKLFIEAMEERFSMFPDESKIKQCYWGEPGRNVYERHLGVSERQSEEFFSNTPIVMFCHPESLNYKKQGKRKRLGENKKTTLPYWGRADEVMLMHGSVK